MKYKDILVVKKPWYWNLIPTLRWCGAAAYYSKIVVRADIYEDLSLKSPQPINVALVEHELTHIKRQHKIGKWKFSLYYQLFPKFRINEELEADKVRFKYIKKHKIKYDLENRARMLSSWRYIWGTSYKKAKEDLLRIYKLA